MNVNFSITVYEADNSTLVGSFANDAIYDGEVKYSYDREDELTLQVDHSHADFAKLKKGRIILLQHTTANFTRRYRINAIEKIMQGARRYAQVNCLALKYDLANRVFRFRGQIIQQNPQTHLNQILQNTGWTAGTVTPINLITIEYNFDIVIDALKKLLEAIRSEEGENYVLKFNDDQTVDLVNGFASSSSTIENGKNLLNMNFRNAGAKITRAIGIGGGGKDGSPMTIAGAKWRIIAKTSTSVILDTGKTLVNGAVNSEWEGNQWYLIKHNDTSVKGLILGTNKDANGNDEYTMDSVDLAQFNIGDYVYIGNWKGIPADFIYDNYLETQIIGTQIEGKYVNQDIPDIDNLAAPEDFSTLSGNFNASGIHDGLKYVVGRETGTNNNYSYLNFSKDTNNIIHGSSSQKVIVSNWNEIPPGFTVGFYPDGVLTGTYQYIISYLTPDGESSPTSPTTVTANKNKIRIEIQPRPVVGGQDEHATHWVIYRTKSNGSIFYKLAVLPLSQITFIDDVPDSMLGSEHNPNTNAACGGAGISLPWAMKAGKQYSFVLYCIVESGSIRAEGRYYYLWGGKSYELIFTSKGTANLSNVKVTIIINGLSVEQDKTIDICVVANGGPATFYLDSFMVVESPVAPDPQAFVAVQGRRKLWEETYDYLINEKRQDLQVRINAVDLYPIDGTNPINVGDIISLIDNNLSINSQVKILLKKFSLLEPYNMQIDADAFYSDVSYDLSRFLKQFKERTDTGQKGIGNKVAGDFDVQYLEEII